MPNSDNPAGEQRGWNQYWFARSSDLPLERMRVVVGALVVIWLLSFFGRQAEFFGFSSWMNRDAFASVRKLPNGFAVPDSPETRLPTPPWSPMYFATTPAAVHMLYIASLAAAAAFTIGVFPVVTAPLTWLAVCSFTSNPIFNGVGDDSLLLVLTFYLMVGYVLKMLLPEGYGGHFALRLLQVHVAIFVFSAGLGKAQQSTWWEGIALWFAAHPAYEMTVERINALREQGGIGGELKLVSAAAYLVLVWQLTFPFLAVQRRARWWIVGGAFFGMLGCWYFYRFPTLGPSWFVASLAYLSASEWNAITGRMRRPSPPVEVAAP